ncbi:MAG: hypothetical protein QY312_02940 [Candidatus Dojkabacteria bacterium]|nr:MAG: hypothetical protein QY312_02940 [Candidatus Dojkabacteria bacterium]
MFKYNPNGEHLSENKFEDSLRRTFEVDRIEYQHLSIATNFGMVSISGSGNMSEVELRNLLEKNPYVDMARTTITCPYSHRFSIITAQKRGS